jgi:aspartokinase-like uncharacterized kinase
MMQPPVVVKLGGSHVLSALLRRWLRAIAADAGKLVLVPGGGPFADGVLVATALHPGTITAADIRDAARPQDRTTTVA